METHQDLKTLVVLMITEKGLLKTRKNLKTLLVLMKTNMVPEGMLEMNLLTTMIKMILREKII